MKKKKSNSINGLEQQLSDIYQKDTALNSLKQFEEYRKSLLGLDSLTHSWQEPTIQATILEMEKAISSKTIQDTFKSHSDYELYANPILSSIHTHNYASLQEEIKKATEPWLDNAYIQTIKANNLFSDSIKNAVAVGLTDNLDSYTSKLSKSALEYANNNKLTAAQSILELTSAIDTDIFQKEMESIHTAKSISEKMMKGIEKNDSLIEQPNYPNKTFDIPMFQFPKYEDTIMGKADKQVEILERLSNYMIKQNKNIELQNEIATDQNNQLKEQNIIIKSQVTEASKTSWIALITAITSIIISSIISLYVFREEDKSDTQNHKEIKELLQENNNKDILVKLIDQLKEQNNNSLKTHEEITKQNQYFETLFKTKE